MSGPITYGDKSGEQSDLVSQPLAVGRTFGRVFINVEAGHECRVYRNSVPYKTCGEGHHQWWDWGFLFVTYTAQVVDIRKQTTTQPVVGSGELTDADGQRIPVTVLFHLSYKLTDINVWFNTKDPMRDLRLLVTNHVTTLISTLPYDPQRPWYIVLRNELERYLQAVAAAQTGLTVLNVLIAKEPTEDPRIVKVYRDRYLAAEAIRQKTARARAGNTDMVEHAAATREAAGQLGINPGELHIMEQPNAEVLEALVKLRAIEAAAGVPLGSTTVTAQPQQPAQLPPGSYTGPNANTNPGNYSGGYAGPGGSSPSGSYGYGAPAGPSQARQSPPFPGGLGATPTPQPGAPTPGYGAQTPPAIPTISSAIDPQRLAEERQRLTAQGYTLTESYQTETRNALVGGQVSLQMLVLAITGQVRAADGNFKPVNVFCYLEPTYPQIPPRVLIMAGQAPRDYPLGQWAPTIWLSSIVMEIADQIARGAI